MPRGRLSMRTIREVLRLKYDGRLTHREIARSCGIAASTVVNYLTRASQAGVSWPLVPELSEQDLEARLFHRPITDLTSRPRPLPDYAAVEEELRRHARLNLTLDLLWREYKEQHPDGYQYTQFVAHYHRWRQPSGRVRNRGRGRPDGRAPTDKDASRPARSKADRPH